MPKIRIEKVIVPPGRWRKEFDESYIKELSESIRTYGVIEPIIIKKETNELVAGECRLRAARLVGLEEIEFLYRDGLDAWHSKAIEFEENYRRKDLNYGEECEAELCLHELYQEKFGKARLGRGVYSIETERGWSVAQSAGVLGISKGRAAQDLILAKAIRGNPSLAKEESKGVALRKIKVGTDRLMRELLANELAKGPQGVGGDLQVINGDSVDVLRGMESESFDFCVTDPPYALNLNEHRHYAESFGEVRSDGEVDLSLHREAFTEVYRLLTPGSHLYTFFSMLWYEEYLKLLREIGFTVRYIPLVWWKGEVDKISPFYSIGYSYDPIFFATKGSGRIHQNVKMVDVTRYAPPRDIRVHPNQKPVELIMEYITNSSTKGERGLDPFLGSGTFLEACHKTGRRGVGIEKDGAYYTMALERIERLGEQVLTDEEALEMREEVSKESKKGKEEKDA